MDVPKRAGQTPLKKHGPCAFYTVLDRECKAVVACTHLPELGADLVTALTTLNVNDLTVTRGGRREAVSFAVKGLADVRRSAAASKNGTEAPVKKRKS